MATCKLYKAGGALLGTGSITAGSGSVTGWTAQTGVAQAIARRNIIVAITSSTHAGSTYPTKVLADNGSGTLTLRDVSPFAT